MLYTETQEWEEMLSCAIDAAHRFSKVVRVYQLLGLAASSLGQFELAGRQFEKAGM